MSSLDLRRWRGVSLGLIACAAGCFSFTPTLQAQQKTTKTAPTVTKAEKPATPIEQVQQPGLQATTSKQATGALSAPAAGQQFFLKAQFDAENNRMVLLPPRGGARQALGGGTCDDPLQCQLPNQGGNGGTLASNYNAFQVLDNFVPEAPGIISSVCWWGGYFNFGAGADCGPGIAADNWEITYYNDSGASTPDLGSIIGGPFAIGEADTKTATGLVIGGVIDEYLYTAAHADVTVLNATCYWIGIQNLEDPDNNCVPVWSTAPPGDSNSFQPGAAPPENIFDLAYCVNVDISETGCGGVCTKDCAVGSDPEGEPTCADNYNDVFNGGCNADAGSEMWSDPGTLPAEICGESGGFVEIDAPCAVDDDCGIGACTNGTTCDDPQELRDTDWYDLTVGVETYMQVTLLAEFDNLAGFLDDQNHTCGTPTFFDDNGADLGAGFAGPCQEAVYRTCLPAGSSTFFVAPSGFGPDAATCGDATYNLTIELADGGQGLGVCPTAQSACTIQDGLQCQFPNQEFNGTGAVSAATSDLNFGFQVYEDVQSLAGGAITTLCWWGTYWDFENSVPCNDVAVDEFTVRYYSDDGGQPGTLIAEFGQDDFTSFNKLVTSLAIPPIAAPELSFTASHAAVPTSAGECLWVSVQGHADPTDTTDCVFLWSTAPPGDDRSWQTGGADPLSLYDLSLCVNTFIGTEGCELAGACCDDAANTCDDDVNVNDCAGRFESGVTCAALDPPCGAGACCDSSNGNCLDTLEGECPANFNPGVFCADSGGSFICNSGCDWDNGPGDPDAAAIACQLADGEFVAAGADNLIFKNPGCNIGNITWYTANFNFQGRCSDDSPCDVGVAGECGGNAGDCTPGLYAGDPSDYDSIDVVLWTNAQDAGDVKAEKITVNLPIPQNEVDGGEQNTCTTPGIPGDCPAGQACFDNDGDGTPQCCLVSEIVSAQPGTINDMDLQFVIEHTWQGDIVISFEKVGFGTPVRIINRAGKDDLHGVGAGPFGYGAPNFGDPTDSDPKLTIDDEAPNFIDINTYDGNGGGIANYAGPAQSGGGVDPAFVLDGFEGEDKAGTWRIYVSDDFGISDTGSLIQWGINFNNVQPQAKGPAGLPVTDLIDQTTCVTDQDCADAGVPACECVGGLCFFDPAGENLGCGVFGPTGDYSGDDTQVCSITSGWTFDAYEKDGEPVEDSWVVTIPTGSCSFNVLEDEKYFISIVPSLPFLPEGGAFYQTAWMISQNADGNPAQSIFEALGAFPWQPIDGTSDLAFSIGGGPVGPCTEVAEGDCGDSDGDGKRDDKCLFYQCDGGVCTSSPKVNQADMGGQFGACLIDNAVDGNDRFLALNCFGNSWGAAACEVSPPTAINVDAGGSFGSCVLDGVCDGNDAFAALNKFGGTSTCTECTGGPSPTAPGGDNRGPVIDVVDSTGLRLVPSADRARPGQTIAVDVYATDGIKDLRGYQLHLGARGGKAGSLELIDIVIEDRPTAAYASVEGEWKAFNAVSEQMVAGLDTPGIATPRGAYLATFIYRVSREARGAFVVDVLHDDAAGSYRTFLFATPANGKIAIDSTSPATIVVGEARSH